MESRPNWLPKGVDLEVPSAARCYDYYLGGAHNFAVDRELARKVEAAVPNVRDFAQNNRAFLRRVVRHLLDKGVRQFLDIGSGIPTAGNVHEIAQQVDPGARVVYVDNEPVAVAHAETILDGNDNADVVHADAADISGVLDSPQVRRLLDFDQPVGVLMVALLHFVPDSRRPDEIIGAYHDRMAPGSYLGVSHASTDHHPESLRRIIDLYKNSSNPVVSRTRQEVADLMSRFELVEPGVVYVPAWHPDTDEDVWDEPERSIVYGALGRKI
ncbi:SAM-dependent methyltransferase [Saccharopolyspora erythraea]|uniref:SAM-dependent methyltransferase n=1 Tax=Saccharopolyspora erythraea TaxID=1836 RepID=UPI001BA600D8|nr:SAM-dependent methyltransferase [Saccharopolyspora erythraea]QUH01549.1 SAM-dependent methyltransferase [Saccharopolyspora erythraea]